MSTLCSADEWCALPALQAYRPQRLETGTFNYVLFCSFMVSFFILAIDRKISERGKGRERVPIQRDDAVVLSFLLSFSLLLALSTLKILPCILWLFC